MRNLADIRLSVYFSCLSNVPKPAPDYPLVQGINWGQVYDADAQCRIINGPDSYFARVCLSSNNFILNLMKLNLESLL